MSGSSYEPGQDTKETGIASIYALDAPSLAMAALLTYCTREGLESRAQETDLQLDSSSYQVYKNHFHSSKIKYICKKRRIKFTDLNNDQDDFLMSMDKEQLSCLNDALEQNKDARAILDQYFRSLYPSRIDLLSACIIASKVALWEGDDRFGGDIPGKLISSRNNSEYLRRLAGEKLGIKRPIVSVYRHPKRHSIHGYSYIVPRDAITFYQMIPSVKDRVTEQSKKCTGLTEEYRAIVDAEEEEWFWATMPLSLRRSGYLTSES